MDNALYGYSPIVDRPKLTWPGDARVAFYVGVNIEHYEVDKPSTSLFAGTSHLKPDPSITAGATTASVSASGG